MSKQSTETDEAASRASVRRKKVVIDARESGTTSGRYVDKLLEHMQKLHPRYDIVLLAKANRVEYLRAIAPDFEVIVTPYKEFTFGEQLGFRRQIDRLEADLVFFPFVQQPVWYSGTVVTTIQDLTTVRFRNPAKNWLIFTIKQQVYKWVNKRVARKSNALIAPTKFVRDDAANFTRVSPDKFTVTYEAADLIPDKPEAVGALRGKQFIMYLGRPTPHKNLWRLVEAFAILRQQFPDLVLALCGRKDLHYQRIEARAKAAGISGIYFTDFVSEGQLKWLYQHCAAYIFPSLSEGFGLPALEAMMHGAPVVSSNATCLPEVYGDSVTYFDPLDVSGMAARIAEVLSDNALRQSLVKKGKARAESYSWRRTAEQTLGVFEKVLNE